MYQFIVFVGLVSCYSWQVSVGVPVSTGSRACQNKDIYAVCNIVPNPRTPSFINGTIYFMQQTDGKCGYGFLSVQVNIDNVPNTDGTDKHGIHVHEYGDMTDGCESMGEHYNPHESPHGSPWNPSNLRHVGDFGNVSQRRKTGSIKTRIVDYLASLHGPLSIIGRGLVLHAGKDDLGLNDKTPDSLKTGDSGGRIACCVIGTRPRIDRSVFSLYG